MLEKSFTSHVSICFLGLVRKMEEGFETGKANIELQKTTGEACDLCAKGHLELKPETISCDGEKCRLSLKRIPRSQAYYGSLSGQVHFCQVTSLHGNANLFSKIQPTTH